MTDKELLELAAKAAGYRLAPMERRVGHRDEPTLLKGVGLVTPDGRNWLNWPNFWNPLTDDGDALRLAMRLKMSLLLDDKIDGEVVAQWDNPAVQTESIWCSEDATVDSDAATRRAIVRVAAEIRARSAHP